MPRNSLISCCVCMFTCSKCKWYVSDKWRSCVSTIGNTLRHRTWHLETGLWLDHRDHGSAPGGSKRFSFLRNVQASCGYRRLFYPGKTVGEWSWSLTCIQCWKCRWSCQLNCGMHRDCFNFTLLSGFKSTLESLVVRVPTANTQTVTFCGQNVFIYSVRFVQCICCNTHRRILPMETLFYLWGSHWFFIRNVD